MKEKTNVMRILEKMNLAYQEHDYTKTNAVSGEEVAKALGQDPKKVFKTLVTVGKTGKYYVFMIPVQETLELKKASASVKEKSIEMVKNKDLLSITGYIHGGCSPIGMKKAYPVTVHKTVEQIDTIIFSAGKIGYQVEMKWEDFKKAIPIAVDNIIV